MEFTFAELLRSYRERASLAQAELAASLHIHRNTLSGWERGQHRPQEPEQVLRLAEELALSPTETDQLFRAAGLPPARGSPTLSPVRHQLRPPIADFVGRGAEIDQLVEALQAAVAQGRGAAIGLVQGMGGCGKTELAYLAAHRLITTFPHAQIVVPLRGTSAEPLSPEQALRMVIYAFTPNARLPDDLSALQAYYQTVLYGQRVLILADDASGAAQVRPLIPPVGSALLITSRMRFTLPGLIAVALEPLPQADAITLLRHICDRLTETDAQTIARTCGQLPLALRISGGILHTLPALAVATYIQRLVDAQQRLRQLRDPDDQTLDVTTSLGLSYAQLDAATQQLFRQLGALVADFAIDMARAVAAMPAEGDVEEMLYDLMRRNLIIYDVKSDRWRLHDLVRDLARRQLEMRGEADAAQWRYAHAAVQLAQAARTEYQAGGASVLAALTHFDAERAHIDAAWRWAMARAQTPAGDQLLLTLAVATAVISDLRYDLRRERLPQLESARVAARRLGDQRGEVSMCNTLGTAYCDLGEAGQAIPCFVQALTIAQALGDQRSELYARGNLGVAYIQEGSPRQAIEQLEQVCTIARARADQRSEGIALAELADAYIAIGEAEQAVDVCRHSLVIAQALGQRRLEGHALGALGRAYAALGQAARANATFAQALDIHRATGDQWSEAVCNWHYGLALVQQGDYARALPLLRAGVAYEQAIGHAQAAGHAALLARLEREGEALG
jgi:tetratricopeptide (TPR) repeat protein/transcriptional regulator with XRE-family HTH domain